MDVIDTVRTGRCNLEFLSKALKIKVNIETMTDFKLKGSSSWANN